MAPADVDPRDFGRLEGKLDAIASDVAALKTDVRGLIVWKAKVAGLAAAVAVLTTGTLHKVAPQLFT